MSVAPGRVLGDRLVGLTAERDLVVNGETYRSRSVRSMRLPGAVVFLRSDQ